MTTDIAKQDPRAADIARMVSGQDSDRVLAIMREIMRSDGLRQCGQSSIMSAIHTIAGWGLDPAPALGQAYVVPFKGAATPIIGYRGMITLLARCGIIVTADIVRDADIAEGRWSAHYDGAWRVKWRPDRFGDDSGQVVGAFAVFASQGNVIHVEQVRTNDPHVAKLAANARPGSPWKTDRDAMLRKTAIRRGFTRLPMDSVELRDLAPIMASGDDVEEANATVRTHSITGALDAVVSQLPQASEETAEDA